ncbi:glycoside hydrolase, partial [Rhizoclosmatium globosum]
MSSTVLSPCIHSIVLTIPPSAFASLDAATGNLKLPSQFNQAIVDSIHAGNPRRPKAILSVGGYYETNFSPIFNNNTLRQNFVNSTINTIQQYGLDGIDIDWEYPGRAGISNNYLSVDSANFVLGLKALKTGLNAKGVLASISATSLPYGFIGADGNYLTDLSGYAANLDFLNIMGYDLNGGSWTTSSAPNAPLGTPLNGDKSAGGIDGSIQKLIKAGFPANKLVLGVPFYGRYVKTVQSMATNGPNNQAASSNSGQPGAWIDYSAITSPAYSTDGPDVLLYKTLQMFVQNPENNLIQYFDNATMTPWFYDIANSVYVTYDNPLSIYVKGSYAACMGLKGVFAWEATHDNNMLL